MLKQYQEREACDTPEAGRRMKSPAALLQPGATSASRLFADIPQGPKPYSTNFCSNNKRKKN